MSEWLKEHAWKACVGETLPWVRIPLSPPAFARLRRASARLGLGPQPEQRGAAREGCRAESRSAKADLPVANILRAPASQAIRLRSRMTLEHSASQGKFADFEKCAGRRLSTQTPAP